MTTNGTDGVVDLRWADAGQVTRPDPVDAPKTWSGIVAIEPRIGALYKDVPRAVRQFLLPDRRNLTDVVGFVETFTERWNEARGYAISRIFEEELSWFVGWRSREPRIATWFAYDVVRSRIWDRVDAEELRVKAEVDAWLARRPPTTPGPEWDAWLLDRPSHDD